MKLFYIILIIVFILASNCLISQPNGKRNEKDTLQFKSNEVVVSALRYPEKIQEVPISISVISKLNLINIRGVGIEEPLNLVPGVLAQTRAGYTDARITIRGFGARGAGDRSNSGTSRGIKFYLDGLPLTEPDGRTSFDEIDFSLADKIEIVRSNASTIWGNAAGGVISINTIPEFTDNFLSVSDLVGSYGLNKLILQSGALMGNSRLNLGFTRTSFDGYRANSESERYLLNIGLNNKIDEKTNLGISISGVSNEFNIPGPLTQQQFDSLPEMANATYLDRKERRFNRIARIGVTLDHNFDLNNKISAMTFLNPKFLQRSERNTFRDFTRYHLGGSANWSNKMDISDDIRNIFLLGIDEQYQDGAIQFFYLNNGERGKLKTNKREGANAGGIFLQDELNFDENLTLLIGGRYDIVTYYTRVYFDGGADILTNNSEDKAYTYFTPKAGISFRLTPNHSIFANMGGGIEVPAGNETDPTGIGNDTNVISRLLEPIISTTYEIGDKLIIDLEGDILKSLTNEISLYYIDTKNELVPYASGVYYLSAAKTSRIGIEWGINLDLFYGLSLRSALTYSVNKYGEYKVDSLYGGFNANYKDNKIAGIPPFYYNTSLKWTMPFLDNVFAEFNIQGIGEYFSDDANKYNVPSFNIINAKIGTDKPISLINGIKIGGFAAFNNLTNAKYAASAFINPDIDKSSKLPLYLEPGLPFNAVVGLTLSWN
jgi:iron complex outermembrane recepter protein